MSMRNAAKKLRMVCFGTVLWVSLAGLGMANAQQAPVRDPAEPQQRAARAHGPARMMKAVARQSVDAKSMLALIDQMVACGTRLTLSSWTDPKRGAGCGRDKIAARLEEIAKGSGGKLQVMVDKFEATAERTSGKPVALENVYAILPGTDEKLKNTVFLVSGHFDSRPSDVMDPNADAPGADDDASGVAVSVECARLLSKLAASGKTGYRATILFAAVSGEEQGLLGSTHLLEWLKEKGYTVGGMLDDDIVGDDPAPGATRFEWCFAWTVTGAAGIIIRFTKRDCPRCGSRSHSKITTINIRRRERRTAWSTATLRSI